MECVFEKLNKNNNNNDKDGRNITFTVAISSKKKIMGQCLMYRYSVMDGMYISLQCSLGGEIL